jgi:2',3'-cyclic-nucleotide 2'-phosphodiesterase/3'-nucleotidase
MPGFWGGHLGLVDLLLEAEAGGGWTTRRARASLRPVRTSGPDAAVSAAAASYHRAALAEIRRPVARCAWPLHTYFAMLEDCSAVRLVNAAQCAAVRAALQGRPEAALPLLSATAPLKAGGLHGPRNFTDVPPGDLALRHLADLYIYPNRLHAVVITGAELRDWLDRAAAIFLPVVPGARDAPLVDPDVPSYAFDAVAGVSYRIDLSAPLGARRVVDLRHDGRAVADADRFVLATNSYRLGGGAGFPRLADRALDLGPAMPCRDAAARYLAATAEGAPLPPPSWSFVPIPGTTVLYPTGPAARRHVPPGGTGPEAVVLGPVGQTADGFDLYRVDLGRADRLAAPPVAAPV